MYSIKNKSLLCIYLYFQYTKKSVFINKPQQFFCFFVDNHNSKRTGASFPSGWIRAGPFDSYLISLRTDIFMH